MYGKATFDNCSVIAFDLNIRLHEGKFESRPSNENMKWVVPHSELYSLGFCRTQIRFIHQFYIVAEDVIRGIVIVDSIIGGNVNYSSNIMGINNFCSKEMCSSTVLNFLLENSTLERITFYLEFEAKMSQVNVAFVTCRNVLF